jgi:hypothetical protein
MLTDGYLKFQVEYDDVGAPYVPSRMLTSDNGKTGSAGQDKRGADDDQDTMEDYAYHKKGQGQAATPGLAKDRKVEEADQVKKERCASGVNDLHKMASSKKRKLDDGEDGREAGMEKAIEKKRGKCQGEAVQRSEVKGRDTFAAGEIGMDHPDSMVDSKMAEGNKMDDLEKKKKKRKGGGQEEEDKDKAEEEEQDKSEKKKKKDKKEKRDSEDEAYEVREEKKKKKKKREKKADSEEADEGAEESIDRGKMKEKKKKKKKGREEKAGGDSDGEERKKMKEKKGKRDGVEMKTEVTDANDVEEFSGESIAVLEEEIRRLKEQVAGIECGVVPGEGQGLDGASDEMSRGTAVQRQRENKKKKKKNKKKKKRASEDGDVPRLSASEKEALISEALRQVALLREAE